MDAPTRALRAVLLERDKLQVALHRNDLALRRSLDAWAASRPGASRGTATEAGARFLLEQAGVLPRPKPRKGIRHA
jgi:hypothetical protein